MGLDQFFKQPSEPAPPPTPTEPPEPAEKPHRTIAAKKEGGLAVAFKIRRKHVDDIVEQRKTNLPKEEQRQMEMDYLRPAPILDYAGTKPVDDPITQLTVKLVLPNKERLAQLKRHFRVASYVEQSVTNIAVLLTILDEMDAGRIVYHKETKSISYRLSSRRTIAPTQVQPSSTPRRTK